ncbi:MAG: TetR/AcrR family transcriptional regulator [Xanthomonadales bacterium]|nr:TetR/AcrR family transcriptional regulator [Xanthomonadales bacterium]
MTDDDRPTTRQRVLDAALRCFARDGFHGASMQQICAEAGVSPGALYRYFRSKDDLIVALVEADREHALAMLHAALDRADPRDGLRALVGAAAADLQDPDRMAMRLEVSAEAARNPRAREAVLELYRAAIAVIAAHIAKGQALGVYGTHLPADALARLLIALGDGVGCWCALEAPAEPESLMDAMQQAVERLLLPQPLSKA